MEENMKQYKIDIVRKLKDSVKRQDDYLKQFPAGFPTEVVFDNDYVNEIGSNFDMLLNAFFKDDVEDVRWWLYDFDIINASTGPHIITVNGIKWTFKTDEDFYNYLKG
jgi:hypothetical protein